MKQEGDNICVNNWKVDFQHYPHTHTTWLGFPQSIIFSQMRRQYWQFWKNIDILKIFLRRIFQMGDEIGTTGLLIQRFVIWKENL